MKNHKKVIVKKPWGYEYLIYKNSEVAIWFLHIEKGERTSMHCHPKKSTGLVLLKGEAEINFIADKKLLSAPSKQMIRRGLFHQTLSLSEGGVHLLEIETPEDKNDLVRLKDSYGRKDNAYENQKFETPKSKDCIWLEEPNTNQKNIYEFSDRTLIFESPENLNFVDDKEDTDILMVVSGGIFKEVEGRIHNVIIPGDVGYAKVIKEVSMEMTGILPNTKVITIK